MRYRIAFALIFTLSWIRIGFADDSVPDQAGQFLSFCRNGEHAAACQKKIVNIYVAMRINNVSFCPPRGTKSEELTGKVLAWLAAHAETHQRPTSMAVSTAYAAVYPCPR